MKTCTKCKESKELSEFYSKVKGKYGKDSRCKVCMRKYSNGQYLADPEKFKAKSKVYREENKDAGKAYREANQDKIKAGCKAWREANPDKIKATHKGYYEASKLDYHIVYYLPLANYCGITMSPPNRMKRHKFQGNDTTGWITLTTAKTEKEALSIEAQYHALGMDGASGYQNKLN